MFKLTKCLCPFEMLVFFVPVPCLSKKMSGEFEIQKKIMHNHYRVRKLWKSQVDVPAASFKMGSSLCVQIDLYLLPLL